MRGRSLRRIPTGCDANSAGVEVRNDACFSGAQHMPSELGRLLEGLSGRVSADRVCEAWGDSMLGSHEPFDDEAYAHRQGAYTLVIGAVAFGGSVPAGDLPRQLHATVRSRRKDLLGLACALHALDEGGRAVLTVPEDLLSADTRAHRALRRQLIEDNTLQAVIRLGAGWYRPRTRAAVLAFSKGGSADWIWFCDVPALGGGARSVPSGVATRPQPGERRPSALTDATREIIDVAARWESRTTGERELSRDSPSFCVSRAEIAAPAFDLHIDRYRSAGSSAVAGPRPHEILAEIAGLEAEIFHGIRQLVGLLKP